MAMKIILDECLKCGACVMVCPRESISEETDDSGDVELTELLQRRL